MSTRIEPWDVWWLDLDPTAGREQGGRRPAIVVSSRFHLALTGVGLISVLPLTTRERPGWAHRLRLDLSGQPISYVITEQVRTVSRARFVGRTPLTRLSDDQVRAVRGVLVQMLDL